MKILMLCAERPRPPLGGGVRSYHFAKVISQISDLYLGILMPKDQIGLPDDLLRHCTSIFHIPSDDSDHDDVTNSTKNSYKIRKTAKLILAPWTLDSAEILSAGKKYCFSHGEIGYDSLGFGLARRLYAKALELEILIGTKVFDLCPARSIERYQEFNALFLEIKHGLNAVKPDVIWLEHTFLFPYAKALLALFPKAKLICNAHNVEYRLHSRLSKIMKSDQARRWYKIQSYACQKMESRWFSKCSLIFCCSKDDKKMILDIAPKSRVEVIPNGVDTSYFTKKGPESSFPTLLFTGHFGYKPNQDAVTYFLHKIYPKIQNNIPDCQLCLAGYQAQNQLSHFANQNSSIQIVANADDLRSCFDSAWVFVAPIRVGSGTRLKILEAMAMSKPVVSTPIGAEGLQGKNNVHFIIAPDENSFATSVVKLLKNANLRQNLGLQGCKLASTIYNWDLIRKQIKNTMTNHVSCKNFF